MNKRKKVNPATAELISNAVKKFLPVTDSEYEAYKTERIKTRGAPDPKTIELFKRIIKECLSPEVNIDSNSKE